MRSRLQKPESPHAPLLLPRHRWHRNYRQRRYRAGNLEEARAEAIVLSGAMLRDSGGKFWNNGQWQLRVVDATGNKVCALTFSADRS